MISFHLLRYPFFFVCAFIVDLRAKSIQVNLFSFLLPVVYFVLVQKTKRRRLVLTLIGASKTITRHFLCGMCEVAAFIVALISVKRNFLTKYSR